MNKLFFSICVLCCILLAVQEAQAFKVSISDPKVEITANPGEIKTGSIKISNPSDQEVEVKVYLEDFLYVEPFDGSKKFLLPGTTPLSCASWISFSPQEFTLPPFAKQKLDYTIRIPDGVKGGYYSVLFFETNLGEMDNAQGYKVDILGRVGSLFFIETKDSIKSSEIKDISVDKNAFTGTIANTGNVFLKAETTFYILDQQSMVIDRGRADDIYTLPGDSASFTMAPAESILPGTYTLIATFDLEEGDSLVREIDFKKDQNGGIKILGIRD